MTYDPEYHKRYREQHADRIKEQKRLHYQANCEKIKERVRNYKAADPERKRQCDRKYKAKTVEERRAYMRERYWRTRDERIAYNREWKKRRREVYLNSYLKKEYGITFVDYKRLSAEQEGCCAICKRSPEKMLHVDHDHATGKVRGLLCDFCNRGLGMFYDSADALTAAAAYLLKNAVNDENTSDE